MFDPTPARATPGGEPLEGKWVLERALGKGGMGTVWLATDLSLHRKVAIKMLAGRYAADAGLVARFEREAQMMARLDHPNLVPVYAVGRHSGVPFIVMKLLEGVTLAEHLRQRGRVELVEVVPIVRQLCLGLQFIHQRGVVHRDIKPANVFVAPDGHVTLLDLGVARDAQSTMTVAGAMVGTPRYMSPEQVLGKRVDHRADLYALATVTFELVTGAPPFDGDDGVSLLRAHLDTAPPDASQVARLPASVGAVLMCGLAKKPEHRFESASEFSAAFERAASEPLAPRPTPSAATTLESLMPTLPISPGIAATQVLPPRRPPIARRPTPPPKSVEPAEPPDAPLLIRPRRRWLVPAALASLLLGGWLTVASNPTDEKPSPSASSKPAAPSPTTSPTTSPTISPTTNPPTTNPATATVERREATSESAEPPRRPSTKESRPRPSARKPEPAVATPPPSEPTEGLRDLPELPRRDARPVAAPASTPTTTPATPPRHRPARAAYQGKLLTEAQTASYYEARDRGASEEAAYRSTLGLPAPAISGTSAPAPRPRAAEPPAGAPSGKVAYDGHLFTEAEARRYRELRATGADHETAAKAVRYAAPPPPSVRP